MSIRLKKIPEETVKVCRQLEDGSWEHLGFATHSEFNDLRIQIKEAKAEGYFVEFEDQLLVINKDGRLPVWPNEMLSLWETQLHQLF